MREAKAKRYCQSQLHVHEYGQVVGGNGDVAFFKAGGNHALEGLDRLSVLFDEDVVNTLGGFFGREGMAGGGDDLEAGFFHGRDGGTLRKAVEVAADEDGLVGIGFVQVCGDEADAFQAGFVAPVVQVGRSEDEVLKYEDAAGAGFAAFSLGNMQGGPGKGFEIRPVEDAESIAAALVVHGFGEHVAPSAETSGDGFRLVHAAGAGGQGVYFVHGNDVRMEFGQHVGNHVHGAAAGLVEGPDIVMDQTDDALAFRIEVVVGGGRGGVGGDGVRRFHFPVDLLFGAGAGVEDERGNQQG